MIASESEPPAELRVREDVQRRPEVDLPDDVRGAEAGDDERRDACASRDGLRTADDEADQAKPRRPPRRAPRRACRRSRAWRRRGRTLGAACGRRGRACDRCGSRAHRRRRMRASTPRTSRSSPAGATRKRTHAPPTPRVRGELACVHGLAERRGDGEIVQVDAERDAAELGVVPAADPRRDLGEQRAVVAEEDLRRRPARARCRALAPRPRPPSTAAPTSAGSSSAGQRCASGTPNAGGGACSRSVTVERDEPAVEDERVDGDDRAADELLDEAVVAARLGDRVGGGRGKVVPVPRQRDAALARSGPAPRRRPGSRAPPRRQTPLRATGRRASAAGGHRLPRVARAASASRPRARRSPV